MREKKHLRLLFANRRKKLSEDRRMEAQTRAFETLSPLLASFETVLSFASRPDEINLWPLNHLLAKEKRLAFPKIETAGLSYYMVEDFEHQLKKQKWNLLEPVPEKCEQASFDNRTCCLVPAIAYDRLHHRLGYGHGHFDRFLSLHPAMVTLGVGFQEQLSESPFPTEPHDQKVTFLYLF